MGIPVAVLAVGFLGFKQGRLERQHSLFGGKSGYQESPTPSTGQNGNAYQGYKDIQVAGQYNKHELPVSLPQNYVNELPGAHGWPK